MTSRLFIVVIFAAVIWALLPMAKGQPPIQPVAVLADIAEALVDTAETVGKFAESLRKGPRAGLRAYDLAAARRRADRLRHIGERTAELHEAPSAALAALEAYLRNARRAVERGASWIERRTIEDLETARVALEQYLF